MLCNQVPHEGIVAPTMVPPSSVASSGARSCEYPLHVGNVLRLQMQMSRSTSIGRHFLHRTKPLSTLWHDPTSMANRLPGSQASSDSGGLGAMLEAELEASSSGDDRITATDTAS